MPFINVWLLVTCLLTRLILMSINLSAQWHTITHMGNVGHLCVSKVGRLKPTGLTYTHLLHITESGRRNLNQPWNNTVFVACFLAVAARVQMASGINLCFETQELSIGSTVLSLLFCLCFLICKSHQLFFHSPYGTVKMLWAGTHES